MYFSDTPTSEVRITGVLVLLMAWNYCSTLNGLGCLTCSVSDLISEAVNLLRRFGRTPWMGNRSILQRSAESRFQCGTELELTVPVFEWLNTIVP
jgi:hypothetical protein